MFGKVLPYAAGGVGLAALENHMVGNNLPPELKRVNLGIGAITGGLVADPKTRMEALSSIPVKEIGLFMAGGLDKFRRTQQDLVGTNLQTAKINQRAAILNGADAGKRREMAMAFLLPALAGGGALAYHAWNHRNKPKEKGQLNSNSGGNKKIRIDIPPEAFPQSFYDSISAADTNPRSRMRTIPKAASVLSDSEIDAIAEKAATTIKLASQDEHPGILSAIGNAAGEFTGIPSLWRAGRDVGQAYNSLEQGTGQAGRYSLGALGNAAQGVAQVAGLTLPGLGKMLGPLRLAGWMRNAQQVGARTNMMHQLTESPSLARFLYNKTYRNVINTSGAGLRDAATTGDRASMIGAATAARTANPALSGDMRGVVDRARDIKFRYNPNFLDYNNPTSKSTLVNKYFSAPSTPPATLAGQVANLPRYLGNRAINAGYWTKQLARRWPQSTAFVLGSTISGKGVVQDDLDAANVDHSYDSDPLHNKGPYSMPISSGVAGLLNLVGSGNQNSGLLGQIGS